MQSTSDLCDESLKFSPSPLKKQPILNTVWNYIPSMDEITKKLSTMFIKKTDTITYNSQKNTTNVTTYNEYDDRDDDYYDEREYRDSF